MRGSQRITWILGFFWAVGAVAGGGIPPRFSPEERSCLKGKTPMAIDNERVLKFKTTTNNQYLDRAYVSGVVAQNYPLKNSHAHFSVSIGPAAKDSIEVVYNLHFGGISTITRGMKVVACGDYITSTAPSGPYPASPDGAILHWVHKNPRGKGHESGFLILDGVVYGEGDSKHKRPLRSFFDAQQMLWPVEELLTPFYGQTPTVD